MRIQEALQVLLQETAVARDIRVGIMELREVEADLVEQEVRPHQHRQEVAELVWLCHLGQLITWAEAAEEERWQLSVLTLDQQRLAAVLVKTVHTQLESLQL